MSSSSATGCSNKLEEPYYVFLLVFEHVYYSYLFMWLFERQTKQKLRDFDNDTVEYYCIFFEKWYQNPSCRTNAKSAWVVVGGRKIMWYSQCVQLKSWNPLRDLIVSSFNHESSTFHHESLTQKILFLPITPNKQDFLFVSFCLPRNLCANW